MTVKEFRKNLDNLCALASKRGISSPEDIPVRISGMLELEDVTDMYIEYMPNFGITISSYNEEDDI